MKPKSLLCKIFGHIPINVNHDTFMATCKRCKSSIRISYDMCYGETINEASHEQ